MKINKKLLGFGTLALPVVVVASMFFAMNPNMNLLNKVQADDVSGSIEFSTTAGTRTLPGNKVITTSGRTSGGFQLYSYAVDNSLTNITSSTIANTCQTYGYIYFSESSTELKHFKFQGVNSITITTLEYSLKNVEIAKSTDGDTFTVEQSTSGYFTSKTFNVSGLRYLRIKVSNNSAYDYIEVTKIVLGYNCSTSYSGDSLESISVVDPVTEYLEGETFVKPKVIAHYEDGTSSNITNYASFSGYDLSKSGNYTVIVSYENMSTSYGITVSGVTGLTGIYTNGSYQLDFDNNCYIYLSEKLYFDINISDSSFTLTPDASKGTSDYDDFGNKRLFTSNTKPNTTGKIASSNTVTINTYSMFGAATKTTFTKS